MKRMNRCGMLIASLLSAQGCALEMADAEQVDGAAQALEKPKLLALGDSIAFGYDPFAEDFKKKKGFVGYPEILDEYYSVKNSACPGESSASFFMNAAPDNGCRVFRDDHKLHVNYGTGETQLDYALSRLNDPEEVPDLITLNISGNDIFLLQQSCNYDSVCFGQGLPAMIGALANNVATILGTLRGAGYQGQLVFMNLYSTDYSNANTVAVVSAINGAIEGLLPYFGAQKADAFGAFLAASSGGSACDAGLLIELPAEQGLGCDVHPSEAGAKVLAQSVLDAL